TISAWLLQRGGLVSFRTNPTRDVVAATGKLLIAGYGRRPSHVREVRDRRIKWRGAKPRRSSAVIGKALAKGSI
ncbi:MAG TPA: hypothetical protein VHX12_11805, partial [Acidisoma sp.]|nr:hypothetical protein [Acidisoma sp.]